MAQLLNYIFGRSEYFATEPEVRSRSPRTSVCQRAVRIAQLLILLTLPSLAQTVVTVRPDCFLQLGALTAPPQTTAALDNRTTGCRFWILTYASNGYSVLQMHLQSAPKTNPDIGPGTFVDFAGTVVTGTQLSVNPATSITSAEIDAIGYFPWMRASLDTTTGSGSVTGTLYGWKEAPAGFGGTGGCPGTVGTPCVVVGPTAPGVVPSSNPVIIGGVDVADGGPVKIIGTDSNGFLSLAQTSSTLVDANGNAINSELIAGSAAAQYQVFPMQFNGSTWDRQFICTLRATLSSSSSGNQQLIALSGGTNIRICAIHFSTGTPENVDITTGTGANCGTGTATIDSYVSIVNFDPQLGPAAALRGGAGNAICVNPAVAQLFKVTAIYAQF